MGLRNKLGLIGGLALVLSFVVFPAGSASAHNSGHVKCNGKNAYHGDLDGYHPWHDSVVGTYNADVFNSLALDDSIQGSETWDAAIDGADTFCGGSGYDQILGFAGNDWIHGGSEDDALHGGPGNDKIYGGYGNDTDPWGFLNGADGNDILDGGPGNDKLIGGNGSDTLYGGTGGSDICNGGPGLDFFYGCEIVTG